MSQIHNRDPPVQSKFKVCDQGSNLTYKIDPSLSNEIYFKRNKWDILKILISNKTNKQGTHFQKHKPEDRNHTEPKFQMTNEKSRENSKLFTCRIIRRIIKENNPLPIDTQ